MTSLILNSILSGLFVGTSYFPFPPWALFICFVPLWILWHKESSLLKIFISGWITQFILTLIGFHWVASVAHEFGYLPWSISILVLILFCCFANLHIPLAGLFWKWLFKNQEIKFPHLLALVLISFIFETLYPMIFPWHMGYPWRGFQLPAEQLAELIGFVGLSLMTWFFNSFFLMAWLHKKNIKKTFLWISFPFSIFIAINLLGAYLLLQLPSPDKTLKVLQVQANIGNHEKIMAEKGEGFLNEILDKYIQLTNEGLLLESVDLILWPEAAIPEFLDRRFQYLPAQKKLRAFIQSNQTALLTGAFSRTEKGVYNSLFLFDKSGLWIGDAYHKTKLLAFGEYFPGVEYLPFLKDLIPAISHFSWGSGATIKELNGVKLGFQICYEGLYPDFLRILDQNHSQIFINATNDSWFGSIEPYQHLQMTAARAIEFRKPLARTTNTGFTTIILATGKMLNISPLKKEWVSVQNIIYRDQQKPTIYSQTGNYQIGLIIFLTCILIILMKTPFMDRLVTKLSQKLSDKVKR